MILSSDSCGRGDGALPGADIPNIWLRATDGTAQHTIRRHRLSRERGAELALLRLVMIAHIQLTTQQDFLENAARASHLHYQSPLAHSFKPN